MTFEQSTAVFHLRYRIDRTVTAPTVIFVPVSRDYPDGYCTKVTGGRATSSAGATRLVVTNDPSASTVDVTVMSGACGGRS
jgi:hypothetical protein